MKRRRTGASSRGASEVISVLLMVAVTIVLAAMVGSALLNVLGDVDDNPLAGASISFDGEDDEIRVVYTVTQETGTSVEVGVFDDEICTATLTEVGASTTFTPGDCSELADGNEYTVRIVAKAPDGTESVVQTQDGSL